MQSMAWSLMMLLLVLAMIPAVLWVVKRLQTIHPYGAPRQLEILSQLALGPRERVLLVRVQGQVLVLGATAQQITLLAQGDAQAAQTPLTPTAGGPGAFASTLFKALGAPAQQPGSRS